MVKFTIFEMGKLLKIEREVLDFGIMGVNENIESIKITIGGKKVIIYKTNYGDAMETLCDELGCGYGVHVNFTADGKIRDCNFNEITMKELPKCFKCEYHGGPGYEIPRTNQIKTWMSQEEMFNAVKHNLKMVIEYKKKIDDKMGYKEIKLEWEG